MEICGLVEERPWFGWGWVSYWPTWVEPFKGLDTKAGVAVMSAHNAWLDVWLQLGIVGVLVFAPIVFLTWHRTWFRAVEQPRNGFGPPLPNSPNPPSAAGATSPSQKAQRNNPPSTTHSNRIFTANIQVVV